MRDRTHRSPDRCADEKTGTEDAASIARSVARRRGNDFQDGEQNNGLQREIAAKNLLDVIITDTQDFGHEPSHQADRESANGRLKPTGPLGKTAEPGTDGEEQFDEEDRTESTDEAEDGIDGEFHWIDRSEEHTSELQSLRHL